MTLRQRFEAWWVRQYRSSNPKNGLTRIGGKYAYWDTETEWQAYRAGYMAGRRK